MITIEDPKYLQTIVDDEIALAPLLHWGNIERPHQITPNCWIHGTNGGERGTAARLARTMLPRWRRDWSAAGPLIGLCGLKVGTGKKVVGAKYEPDGYQFLETIADHPDVDFALRAAIVRAATAYLTARRARGGK